MTFFTLELDHGFTRGMHLHDPDANEVELFVDVPRVTSTRLCQPADS